MDARYSAPAALRNRDPILAVLRDVLPPAGLLLEIASGSGEHALHWARHLPGWTIQPSDADPAARASTDAWAAGAGLDNLRPALPLDAAAADWPVARADAVLCVNMIHIAPWPATPGLLRGAARCLAPGAPLILYGPFRRAGQALEPSNAEFDASLRQRHPEWGLRVLEEVAAEAARAGFGPPATVAMPANNLSVIFRRAG
ncbi:DUF938 domain-containing protein [Teichococcus cervicalis]|uniref:SAM-dependent methyltransferase n=1 Tax=Pseudoroseomonas cervicalis ATCC 49957 TaxID=525371 RepID=D5RGP8_9PROT|nr:DUF938 domain-containing protein [Pseudoroseomonas cervicalis]EFH13528.1 hypothetical protein HMPREF0731_0257 [Pseudoroseomonas cervicalis ATCC 49957]